MANANLKHAKKQKNDEFYTQYQDIQKEVNAYLEYDKEVFRGKTILLPCDDPEWSNFTKFFAQNFENFGIKKLISTSFAVESKNIEIDYEPSLFESIDPRFDKTKTRCKGKIFIHLLAQSLRMIMSVSAHKNQTTDNKIPNQSLTKLMMKLQTLQVEKPAGRGIWIVKEIPKKTRDLFELLNVPLPKKIVKD